MKAGNSAIRPWLSCQYTENTLMDLPSSVGKYTLFMWLLNEKKIEFISGVF